MSDINTTTDRILEEPKGHLSPSAAPSQDPDYLAWRDKKVAMALREAREHPEKMIPEHEVWKKFGLEY